MTVVVIGHGWYFDEIIGVFTKEGARVFLEQHPGDYRIADFDLWNEDDVSFTEGVPG